MPTKRSTATLRAQNAKIAKILQAVDFHIFEFYIATLCAPSNGSKHPKEGLFAPQTGLFRAPNYASHHDKQAFVAPQNGLHGRENWAKYAHEDIKKRHGRASLQVAAVKKNYCGKDVFSLFSNLTKLFFIVT